MDSGHGVIDKFSPEGRYLSQIGGFPPSTGSASGELLGLGVDGNGTVHVDVIPLETGELLIDEFDGAGVNIARQEWVSNYNREFTGLPGDLRVHGFAVSATGDDYPISDSEPNSNDECTCTAKFGQKLAPIGRVDSREAGDVAVAVDPATGHLYADDQSSVAEWDTGAINGNGGRVGNEASRGPAGGATLVARFGSLELSGTSGEGGIAVDGATGDVYVSSPASGKVYVFGSDVPAVTAGEPTSVTKVAGSLSGTVDPRGVAVSSCEFQWGLTDEYGNGIYNHSVPCKQTPAEIGAGSSPVAVSAQLEGLKPDELYHFRLKAVNASGPNESAGLLATQGEGFGIKSFDVSFLNENGTPDTQAGSHPYQFVNTFTLNSHFEHTESNANSVYIRLPDGVLRDVTIDLPPGFVGDPDATAKKCTAQELRVFPAICPHASTVGLLTLSWGAASIPVESFSDELYNMVPPRGVALQLGSNFYHPLLFINNQVSAGGDYPVQATVTAAPGAAPVIKSTAVISGVITPCVQVQRGSGEYNDENCEEVEVTGGGEFSKEPAASKPFLTLPTGCHGPLRSTMAADSWAEPGHWAKASTVTHNAAGSPVSLTGCSKLKFPPEISVAPDSSNASTSSGLTVNVKVPQASAFNPNGLAESSLRDTTVTLPEGVAINPSGGSGLEACSSDAGALPEGALGSPGDQIGYKGQEELNAEYEPGVKWNTFTPELASPLESGSNFCPNGSKIGTVKIKTPLLEHELEGAVYLATQDNNPFGSLLAMYLVVEDPFSGSLVKLAGEVSLNPDTGQISTTFKNTPDLPFETLELHFFGGERAPLATPSHCGTYTTTAVFAPWDGNGPVTSESSFKIEHGPGGGPCPGASLPFNPSVNAGATNIQAGAFSPLTVTLNRKDGEQNLKSIEAKLPPGLSGVLTGVELCPEPQADEGLCGEGSKIGEATIGVGVGNDPFTVTGGRFYLTGPYNGHSGCTVGEAGCAPFGITFEVPAKAGPFDLANTKNNHPACDCVVVRGKIELNPQTAAITITSNPPGSPDSIPTSHRRDPPGNPARQRYDHPRELPVQPDQLLEDVADGHGAAERRRLEHDLNAVPGHELRRVEVRTEIRGLDVREDQPGGRGEPDREAGLPERAAGHRRGHREGQSRTPQTTPLTPDDPAEGMHRRTIRSKPGRVPHGVEDRLRGRAHPLIPVPLQGPAIFVSHGGEAFPSLTLVLQGYGITIDLVGTTDIKNGVTSTTFKTVPDQPFSSFELTLPEGPYSALTAPGNLCTAKNLTMPTEFVAQNGAELNQATKIAVTGCPKHKKADRRARRKAERGKHKHGMRKKR